MLLSPLVYAQEEDEQLAKLPTNYKLKLQVYRYKEPIIEDGEKVWCYLRSEVWVYPPLESKSEKQRHAYNHLVNNVKKVLPIAQQVNGLIEET